MTFMSITDSYSCPSPLPSSVTQEKEIMKEIMENGPVQGELDLDIHPLFAFPLEFLPQ